VIKMEEEEKLYACTVLGYTYGVNEEHARENVMERKIFVPDDFLEIQEVLKWEGSERGRREIDRELKRMRR